MAAAVTFRSLQQPVSNGVPVPLPSVRLQGLQRHRVGLGLHLFAFPRGRPVLLPPPAAAAGEAFSSDGEEFGGEEEYFDEGESEAEEEQEVEAPRAYSSPRSRPPRGEDPGRLFVGNLPYTFTSEAFAEAGRVDDAQVPPPYPPQADQTPLPVSEEQSWLMMVLCCYR